MDEYKEYLKNNEANLISSFSKIPMDLTDRQYTTANHLENNKKNNFNNVLASDETRVKLNRSNNDYINANYILEGKYIATQQPNTHTIADFWHMIYQTQSKMVINVNGDNNYLPLENKEVYDDITVNIISESKKQNLEIRKLQLYRLPTLSTLLTGELPLIIYHVTFLRWKDFDVPKEEAFMRLLTMINIIETTKNNDRPIVIHCKAGIGRTGTFILIHYIYKQIQLGNYLNPIDTLRTMRKARLGMVQNKKQFCFALNIIKNLPKKNKNPLSNSCGEIYTNHTIKKSCLSMSTNNIMRV